MDCKIMSKGGLYVYNNNMCQKQSNKYYAVCGGNARLAFYISLCRDQSRNKSLNNCLNSEGAGAS